MLYILSTLLPATMLAMGCLFGGGWSWLGLISMTALVYGMDRVLARAHKSPEGEIWICWVIGAAHLGLLVLTVWQFETRVADLGNAFVLWLGLSLWFGQVANSTAHELIHQPNRVSRRAGTVIFASLLNGHHVSAHLKVHHVHTATERDPNSARIGESAYAFFLRALTSEFTAGLQAENTMRTKTLQRGIHPYVIYLGISALALASAFLLGGFAGVTALLTLSIYAQLQLLLSDYVQHYGLRRTTVGGRLEPVGPQHSWNAPHAYSGAMMLNAPRHSDHHASPGKPYGDLVITPQDMPVLPRSLPVMATIALVPPLWHWMMDKRAAKWSTQSREAVTKNTAIAGADDRVLSG